MTSPLIMPEKFQSLAEFLGVADIKEPTRPVEPVGELSAKEFCEHVLNSPEFRTYIRNGIVLGDLPSQVIVRIMDIGWGKPTEHIDLSTSTDLDHLTPQAVREKLERVQRMLRLLEFSQQDEDEASGKPVH